jgi:alpha-tubulin suppressor-like RCC1 family protein
MNEGETTTTELVVWGRNQSGQLGIEPEAKSVVKIPHSIRFDMNVRMISCGKAHTAFIIDNGTVYTMGNNKMGQLGLSQTIL